MNYDELTKTMMNNMFLKPRLFKHSQNVSHGEMGILLYLSKVKDGVSPGELSNKVNISTGRTAIALKCLEKKQYITRHKDIEDARHVVVNITEAGKLYEKESSELVYKMTREMLERLSVEDAAEYVRLTSILLGENKVKIHE